MNTELETVTLRGTIAVTADHAEERPPEPPRTKGAAPLGAVEAPSRILTSVAPIGSFAVAILLWEIAVRLGHFPPSLLPSPRAVFASLLEELASGRIANDVIISLYRITCGFVLAVALGVPLGLWLGCRAMPRAALLAPVNFLRNLSPMSWIPFAVLWFGIGDVPVMFLIFLATILPLILSATSAAANMPAMFRRLASDCEINGARFLFLVVFPATLPQIITALRMAAGLAWVVLVAGEMIAGRDGLGFALQDARNGLRADLLVVNMIVIGTIGLVIDSALARLREMPRVRWAYE